MRNIFLMFMLFVAIATNAQVENYIGKWVTIDDNSGEKRSVVEVYKGGDGTYYGKIVSLFEEKYSDAICEKCEGEDNGKKIVGLVILRGMEYKDGVLQGGRLLDPESGKYYYGKISYDKESGDLKLRGSIDKRGWLGRTQVWKKQ